MSGPLPPFDSLTPDLALEAIAEGFGLEPDGSFETYPSYVNRVFGLRDADGAAFVAKFYRPGRWSLEAIREEHAFVAELAAEEVPVVAPLPGADGGTLQILELEADEKRTPDEGPTLIVPFALYPKRSGRSFDAESEEDWRRLGSLAGRIHAIGARKSADAREHLSPGLLRAEAEELLANGVIHPDCRDEFTEAFELAEPLVDAALQTVKAQRLHGDFHRGNILDRRGEGLLLVDFDDMALGPAVQDLWLLLPGHARDCAHELGLVLEGYGDFAILPEGSTRLIEPLRFLRMLRYLAWQARQRRDLAFPRHFPDWGGKAFWIRECVELAEQARRIAEGE